MDQLPASDRPAGEPPGETSGRPPIPVNQCSNPVSGSSKRGRFRRRAMVRISAVVALLVSSLALLPQILLHSTLRNRLLSSVLPEEALSVESDAASGGWFSPLVFQNVRLKARDNGFEFSAERVQSAHGLWSLLLNPQELGTLKISQSHVTMRSGPDGGWKIPVGDFSRVARATFEIRDAGLTLIVPWRDVPIVRLTGLQIQAEISRDHNGVVILNVDPIVLADQVPVSAAASKQNLVLIAPVLSQATNLEGTVTASLDAIRIPLNGSADMSSGSLRGHAIVHSLSGILTSDWIKPLAMIPGSGVSIHGSPITIPAETRIDFAVTEDGVVHDGLAFSLPQLAGPASFESAGVLRLDGTLDLALLLSLPPLMNANRPFLMMLNSLAAEPVALRVTGTIARPQLALPENSTVLSELARRVAPAAWEAPAPPLPEAVGNLIQDAVQPAASGAHSQLPGDILQLIQSIRESRKSHSGDTRPRRAGRPARRQR